MKANQTLTQIAQILGWSCSTISRKVKRGPSLSWHDRRGQIANRRKIGEHPTHNEARKQVGPL
jgi:IS30 family transposase